MPHPAPKVSVLMTTWKRPQYISGSIQSIIDQTFTDWELIIVDDGSPDNTAEVVGEWVKKDKRIKYFKLEHKGRIAVVANAGLREAKGEYVAILDDDDRWIDPKKLERQVAFLDANPEYIGCGGCFTIIDKDDKEIGQATKPLTDEAIRRVALYANPMANSTSIFRREAAGFYDESMPQFADWDFWLRAGLKGKLKNFPDFFLAYRMWDQGMSFAMQNINVATTYRIVRRYRGKYPGYFMALMLVAAYGAYSLLPLSLRRGLNSYLSRLKKMLFGR